jgi:heme exporter protein A
MWAFASCHADASGGSALLCWGSLIGLTFRAQSVWPRQARDKAAFACASEPAIPALMQSEAAPLLSGTGLGMIRGERVLFREIGVEVRPGNALVLRGANGTGKTTLLRILAGLTRPETGSVNRPAAIHWFGHREGLKPQETPRAHLELWAQAWGSNTDIPAILAGMGLARPADVAARYLSAGQRRRTALARLLLEQRPVWLLDEPYTALDAEGRARVDGLVADHRAQGGAVIAAIHGESGCAATAELAL